MKRYRTLLSVLLGLVLLLQGLAVSAAPYIAAAAPAEAEMAMDMPCHGQMSEKAGKQDRSCCSSTCPDMTTCALGHLAASVSVIFEALSPVTHAEHSFTLIGAVSTSPTTLLRPPISLHS